jgi:hypothetical protein
MAVEGLTLTPPTGSAIDLNGAKWGLEALSIGQPARREDLISSLDADGGLPARVSPRDVREVTATVRLLDAANMNAALNSIADLERVLESAERIAASGWTNPVLDLVRLVYTPAGSTYSFSLIVLAAEIVEIPREMTGDGVGFFIARPVVTLRAICDPFAYGTTGSSPFTTTYLDKTTTSAYAVSETVAGGVGDVSPWLRLKVKDVDSKTRNRIIAGVRRGEATANPVIPVSGSGSVTAVVGSVSSGTLTTTSTEWVVSASLPRQTRKGSFRVYLAEARSEAATGGSVRLVTSEAGGSRRTGSSVELSRAGRVDAYLGEVIVDTDWDGWIETTGSVAYTSVILIPTDSYVEVFGASTGRQLVGSTLIADTLQTTSTTIGGRNFTTGTGSWSHSSGSWPVSATNWARRTATGMSVPEFAVAGSGNYIEVDIQFRTRRTGAGIGFSGGAFGPVGSGVALRYDPSGYTFLAAVAGTIGDYRFVKYAGGAAVSLWSSSSAGVLSAGTTYEWRVQVTADGRWYIRIKNVDGVSLYLEATGQDADLVSGGALGNTSAARVALYDFYDGSPAVSRDISNFQISSLAAVTPAPLPSGATLTLSGPRLLNGDNSDYPYVGSSGIEIRPGVDNNLTVMTRRSSGFTTSGAASTDPLDLDIDGYPRFISVPHT